MRMAHWEIPVGYALLTMICWLVSARQVERLTQFWHQGVQVTATVTDKRIGGGKSTTYKVGYRFEAQDQEIEDDATVGRSAYDSYEVGDHLVVTYLKSDPSDHVVGVVDQQRIDRRKELWQEALFFLTGIAAAAYGIVIATYNRQAKLLREGTIVEAQIVSVEPKSTGKSNGRNVNFVYSPASGITKKGIVLSFGGPIYRANVGDKFFCVFPKESPRFAKLVQTLSLVELAPENEQKTGTA
jgi:hypothetical protein